MAKKKELDKLSLAMIECEKAGYGCHYGAWYAATHPIKEEPEAKEEKKEKPVPEGWLICQQCGKAFKPKTKQKQKYCEPMCQYEHEKEKYRTYRADYKREWAAKQKEGIKV